MAVYLVNGVAPLWAFVLGASLGGLHWRFGVAKMLFGDAVTAYASAYAEGGCP